MPANEIIYDFDLEEVVRVWEEAGEQGTAVHQAAERAVLKILDVLQGQVQGRTPVNRGHLRASFEKALLVGTPVGIVEGELATPLVYGIVMELGRTPGERPPPTEPIELWVLRKGLVNPDTGATYEAGSKEIKAAAYVIARAIGSKGIPGHFMVRDGVTATRPAANRIWDNLLGEIIGIMANE